MGYARYSLPSGKPAGYDVTACCDAACCDHNVDRGTAYRCHGEGCENFCCTTHLRWATSRRIDNPHREDGGWVCPTCFEEIEHEKEDAKNPTDRRALTQAIIAEIGSIGPENLESAVARAVEKLKVCRPHCVEDYGALLEMEKEIQALFIQNDIGGKNESILVKTRRLLAYWQGLKALRDRKKNE